MLERIINITAGSDYKQSSRPSSRQANALRSYGSFNISSNDSVLLSPATAFLSSINWRLKKVASENEKITIVFSFDDFEFCSNFFVAELMQNRKIDYDIKYQLDSFVGTFDIYARIAAPFRQKPEETMLVKNSLDALKDFVKSVFKTNVDPAVNWAENFDVQKIFSDMEYRLHSEFDYINGCLINFIEKYLSLKLNIKNENDDARSTIALNFLQLKKT